MISMMDWRRKETIGDCTLYLGNAYDIVPLLVKIDALVTDPPYEFETSAAGKLRRKRPNMGEIRDAGLNKGFDHTAFTSAQFGSCVMFCHNDQMAELLNHVASQWDKYAVCAWHKTNPMPVANKHYKPDTELYIHAWSGDFHPVGDLPQKARFIVHPNGQDTGIPHPTVKPLAVMGKIISNVNGETVCDPFMGSGTTGVACVKAGKRFIGIEWNERFFELAVRRIKAAYSQMDMFMPRGGEVPKRQEVMI